RPRSHPTLPYTPLCRSETAKLRAFERARQASAIAAQEHRNSPRGGANKNMYGQNRSAPGEAPAEETGRLLHLVENGTVHVTEGGDRKSTRLNSSHVKNS